jgi:hypothetical protein
MASYPTSVKTFTTKNPGDKIASADVNDLQSEVNAIEAGLLNGTANLNSSNSTLVHLSVISGSTLAGGLAVSGGFQVTGNSTVGSSITIGTIPYVFPSSGGSTGQVLMCVSTNGSTMTTEWRVPAFQWVGGSSGRTASNVAANLATVAIAGLTPQDTLDIDLQISASSQNSGTLSLVSATDGNGTLLSIGAITANTAGVGTFKLFTDAAGANSTVYTTAGSLIYGAASFQQLGPTQFSATTPSTSAWSFAFRGSVVSGGTLFWRMNVYRKAGQ